MKITIGKFAPTLISALISTLAVLATTGCDFSTPNGKVPAKYLPAAQRLAAQYAATFQGHFYDWDGIELSSGTMNLRLTGDVVSLHFNFPKNESLIGEGCNASVGAMSGGAIDEQTKKITALYFDFSPGSCAENFSGRTLAVQFGASESGKPALRLALIEFEQTSPNGSNPSGGAPCNPYEGSINCDPGTTQEYDATGIFTAP